MDTDVQALLKDKRLWIGAGVVGIVGVFALLRKKPSTSAGGATTGTASGPSGTYTQGAADTTGTDIASYLGNYQQSLQGQLTQYQQQLTDTLATLPKVGTIPNQPVGMQYGHTGVLSGNDSLEGLSKLYWGDNSGADLLRLANLDAITRNNGNLTGLNLIVPNNPSKST
jgi:hypothetical protein